jgi:putative radical SAM enzyme (TIGR03279 family)
MAGPLTTHRRQGGVIIHSVAEGSLAELCGIEPGDRVEAINGFPVPDSLSFFFNIAMPDLLLDLRKADGTPWQLEVDNAAGEPFGVVLQDDPIMLCRNKCIFCFVDQNPKGYRPTLLIKDEDIRLSFMYGNYSTLSSTDEAEEERIIRERISPLYISVHASDPQTRIFLLKSRKAGNILERLQRLAAHQIEFHAQIVLCPGINDGAILERTIADLAGLHPQCRSVAVVPLGITRHRQKLVDLRPVDSQFAADVVAWAKRKRRELCRTLGDPFMHLGDEFYLKAGQNVPGRRAYRNFPQMENGIGMVRRFIDQFKRKLPQISIEPGLRGTLVTGVSFAPVLSRLIDELNQAKGSELQVMAIRNDSFGPDTITVAGLVHAQDIMNQLAGTALGSFVVIPRAMVKDGDDPIMIDNFYPHQVAQALGVPLVLSGNEAAELLRTLNAWVRHVVPEFPIVRSA